MSLLFKKPTNSALASRLKQKLMTHRERCWTSYVNEACRVYQAPQKALEHAHEPHKNHDRDFLLFHQVDMEDIDRSRIQNNYGYLLYPTGNQVYLVIPSEPITFEKVDDKQQASIRDIILRKTESCRKASWEDMDAILSAFYGDQPESPCETPQYLQLENNKITAYGDGKFHSNIHAPNAYAFKKFIINGIANPMEIEKEYRKRTKAAHRNPEQEKATVLINLPWYSRSKENFSWSPLVDGIVGPPPTAHLVEHVTPNLQKYHEMVILAIEIDEELARQNPNINAIRAKLERLQTLIVKDNILIELILAIGGIVGAPIALLIGLIWLLPSCYYKAPYMSKPQFFLDALHWFVDSLINAFQCLNPVHAYNASGSTNILKGECTRIVETLLARLGNEEPSLEFVPSLLPE